jgi:hypothetical protein
MLDMFTVPYVTQCPPVGDEVQSALSDLNIPLYRDIYTTASESVVVPSNGYVLDMALALGRRLRRTPVSAAKAPRGVSMVSVTGEIRWGLARSYGRGSSGRKLSRDEMILGADEQMGTIVERQVTEMLAAVNSLLEQMDELWEDIAYEYGISIDRKNPPLRIPGRNEDPTVYREYQPLAPKWSYFFSRLRFPEDEHLYTLWSDYGILDLIKHDTNAGDEIERTDIRSYNVLRPANTSEIRIFRRKHKFAPFRDGLVRLRDLLQSTPERIVTLVTRYGEVYEGKFRIVEKEMPMDIPIFPESEEE